MTSWPDATNGAFETLSGLAMIANITRLYKDKLVRGVDWRVTVFFIVWGLWNLFYYPNLHQWFSLSGGIVIVAANLTWLAFAIHYGKRTSRIFSWEINQLPARLKAYVFDLEQMNDPAGILAENHRLHQEVTYLSELLSNKDEEAVHDA